MALLRLAPSAAVKRRRLEALRAQARLDDAFLEACVEDARLLGSLELAGVPTSWGEIRAARRGEPASAAVEGLRRAIAAVPPQAPLDRAALRAWHSAVTGGPSTWRARARERGVPPAPPERIEGRIEILEGWLAGDAVARLGPAEAGALVLSRLVEILPFADGNGRVARLALDHAFRRAGGQPPILAGGDAARLQACLEAAFALDVAPLVALLEEGSERCLDVMIQALEGADA
jgi:fido (protein-threonine AMPylation protein)